MRTILSVGCFDMLHPGHIEHLRQAGAMGDQLVVGVASDYWAAQKGPGRPVFTDFQRVEMVRALRCVDVAIINVKPNAIDMITELRPALYVKGPDYADRKDGTLELERQAVRRVGGDIAFTTGPVWHSTDLIRENGSLPSNLPFEWLADFNQRYSASTILEWLAKAQGLNVGVIGERIIDEYVYVEPEGRSAKDSHIVWREVGSEEWQGGGAVVAEHARAVSDQVTYINDGDGIRKRRYVHKPFGQKVYATLPNGISVPPFVEYHRLDDYDTLIVVDYGHGLIPDRAAAETLTREGNHLALNVQANSLNWGFNTLRKWERANYIVVNEMELRLGQDQPYADISYLAAQLYEEWEAARGAVTLGHKGCLVNSGNIVTHIPAFADKVVDRMGAGDAFLACTAPLAFLGAPAEVIGFVGNIAAAIKIGKLGNQPVTRKELHSWVKTLIA